MQFVRSHDKTKKDGTFAVFTTDQIKSMSIEQMKAETIIGVSRYIQLKNEIDDRIFEIR